ncbi:flagellar filament capping protein FliD [Paenibacillus sp. D2_2]|uniref:flagellar filament capping protein FliD n=1 Tax=Paenibacillus sp. D2_2 TaxID=3073092 RepID=UPI002815CF2F|nr:flagellar filament capping protein FliD [Paenibacillus sp. D2_2]WMT40660.1 flagellar filament capping protein FliD [Paenibacillus sp. D2_2]
MRISGLASGMDIDSIVKQMMQAKRVPLDKLTQQKQTIEWKRDFYRQINSQLVDFRNNKLWKYKTSSELNPYKAEVSGDKDAISVKATSSTNQVKMTVEVQQLATQRSITSVSSLGNNVTKNTRLDSLAGAVGEGDDGKQFSLTVSRSGGKDVTLEFSSSDTIDSVIRKINSDTQANVTAALDETTGKITLKSKEYGNQNVDFGGNLMDAFNLSGSSYVGGDKAEVSINGSDPLEYSSNTFTVNGVEITLLAETEAGKPSIITSKTDSTKVLETIKSFISDYNSVLATINGKLNEERYRNFPPLTDEQKSGMKEDDIKRWQEKAQSGLLRNDEILTKAVWDMRDAVTRAEVKGASINLSSIGITTGEYYENGKLVLDEDKLKKAIEDNPDAVLELFVGADGTSGFFNKLYDNLMGPLESLSERAGTSKYSTSLTDAYNTESVMGKELKSVNDRISDLQKKLTTLESKYYSQFTAMETAINKMNSQSSSITNLLSQ